MSRKFCVAKIFYKIAIFETFSSHLLILGRMVDDSGKSLVIILLERGKFIRFVDIFAGGFWSMARAEGNIIGIFSNKFFI
jgi:hypothetical protein